MVLYNSGCERDKGSKRVIESAGGNDLTEI